MVEHTQTIRRLLPTKCLSAFDHFWGLALKRLTASLIITYSALYCIFSKLPIMTTGRQVNIIFTQKTVTSLKSALEQLEKVVNFEYFAQFSSAYC